MFQNHWCALSGVSGERERAPLPLSVHGEGAVEVWMEAGRLRDRRAPHV